MHELSLAASILDLIAEKVPSGASLHKVNVTVGPLAGIWTDSLEFCFNELAQERGYDNARICIAATQAKVRCSACRTEYDTGGFMDACPNCGSLERTVLSGTEFTVDSLETED
ncbi:MAG: hypothetical protein GF350_09120 [Chitinivibrionales bacterium]|nr:hypothetical protein [Chitinivibrionales bacterium]